MGDLAYQITRYGEGFDGRKRRLLSVAVNLLGLKLLRVNGPYQIVGEEKLYHRPEVKDELTRRFRAHPNVQQKFVVRGKDYDQPAWSIRSIQRKPDRSPLVNWLAQFTGRSSYLLGADGPPGPSDCSAATQGAVKAVYGIDLVHSADQQMQDSRIEHFHDPDDCRSGDFVFLNYGRLNWPHADHVEFWVSPGLTIGSRPSTNGVNYYNFASYDRDRVITYGRLKRA